MTSELPSFNRFKYNFWDLCMMCTIRIWFILLLSNDFMNSSQKLEAVIMKQISKDHPNILNMPWWKFTYEMYCFTAIFYWYCFWTGSNQHKGVASHNEKSQRNNQATKHITERDLKQKTDKGLNIQVKHNSKSHYLELFNIYAK